MFFSPFLLSLYLTVSLFSPLSLSLSFFCLFSFHITLFFSIIPVSLSFIIFLSYLSLRLCLSLSFILTHSLSFILSLSSLTLFLSFFLSLLSLSFFNYFSLLSLSPSLSISIAQRSVGGVARFDHAGGPERESVI